MNSLPITTTTDKRIPGDRALVVGLGKTGMSSALFLSRCGYEVAVTDSRQSPPALDELTRLLPDVAVFLGEFSREALETADFVVASPGLTIREGLLAEAVERDKPVFGDIEIFAHYTSKPVFAITGSNGKSTVTALLGEMARIAGKHVAVGGNIGVPVLDLIQPHEPDLYVLELSSFQLETTFSLDTRASALLNISEDHMDRYKDIDDYAKVKSRIFRGNGTVVVNRDDVIVMAMAKELAHRKIVTFGLGQPADTGFGLLEELNDIWIALGSEPLLPVSMIRIKGRHNISNALAALALGREAGLPMPAMLEALQRFPGLPHRTQFVAEREGVEWFNDSKATNVGAAVSAVNGMMGRNVVLLAGGQAKGQDFSPLGECLRQHARAVILLGEDAEKIEHAIGAGVSIFHANTMTDAVAQAAKAAVPGDVVLLSPACASFDMFKSYEDRGEQFMDAVRRELA